MSLTNNCQPYRLLAQNTLHECQLFRHNTPQQQGNSSFSCEGQTNGQQGESEKIIRQYAERVDGSEINVILQTVASARFKIAQKQCTVWRYFTSNHPHSFATSIKSQLLNCKSMLLPAKLRNFRLKSLHFVTHCFCSTWQLKI